MVLTKNPTHYIRETQFSVHYISVVVYVCLNTDDIYVDIKILYPQSKNTLLSTWKDLLVFIK